MSYVLAFRHVAYEDLDGFAPAFVRQGYRIVYRDAWYDEGPFDPLEPDVLVVLGAPIGIYEAADFPFIQEEMRAVRLRIEKGRPVLGICFGAQMLAAALGSRVDKGPLFEFGWSPLMISKAGMSSPIRHYGDNDRAVFHCHGDTFELPKGAKLLASTPNYANQAFSIGPHLACQFHGEVTERGLRRWHIAQTGRIRSLIGHQELKRQTKSEAPKVESILNNVIFDWLDTHATAGAS